MKPPQTGEPLLATHVSLTESSGGGNQPNPPGPLSYEADRALSQFVILGLLMHLFN